MQQYCCWILGVTEPSMCVYNARFKHNLPPQRSLQKAVWFSWNDLIGTRSRFLTYMINRRYCGNITHRPGSSQLYLDRWKPLVKAQLLHAQSPGAIHERMPRVRNVPMGPGKVHLRWLKRVTPAERDFQVIHQPLPAGALAPRNSQRPDENTPIFCPNVGTLLIIF